MRTRSALAWAALALLCWAMSGCTISSTPGTKTPVSLSILPTNPTLPLGLGQSFFAVAKLHDGTYTDVTAVTQWTSSNKAVATIDSRGNLKTVSTGITTVTAAYASLTASTGVTVTPPGIIAVDINPANPSPILVGDNLAFTATGIMSDGSASRNITDQVKWASSNSSVASITSSGSAAGDAVGVTIISATYGSGQNAPAGFVTLIVDPLLESITVLPVAATIAESTNQQFTAIGYYNDGSTQDITNQSSTQWSCTPSGIVSSLSKGLAKVGTTSGACNVTATATLSNGSTVVNNPAATLTVSVQSLTALSVTAVPKSAIGVPVQFHATGLFGSWVQDLTSVSGTKWTSSNTSVAANPSSGKATPLAQGTATITAKFPSLAATSNLTVTNATLSSIKVKAPLTQLGEGTTVQLTATGTFTDSTTQDLTNVVTWKSSGSAISVSSTGLATANLPGSATVTASLAGVSGTSPSLQVNPETIKSVAITPAAATIAAGTIQQFKAMVTFSDNTQQDITSLVQWNSSDASVATVADFGASAGSATGLAVGNANISAVFGSVTASTSILTVTSASPSSLAITGNATMSLGSSQQQKATVTFSDSSTQDVTSLVTWSSDNIGAVVVTSSGQVFTAGTGGGATANVSATFSSPLGGGPVTNSTKITVQ